jgi:hypothetical protein
MSRQKRLRDGLLAMSANQDWENARLEWVYSHSHWSNEAHHCLCGQAIKNLCYIVNPESGNQLALVGCVCVEQFIDPEIGQFAKRINHTIRQLSVRPNYRDKDETLIQYALKNKVISAVDYSFLGNIRLYRNLSEKQLKWLNDINAKMIAFATTPRVA